MALVKKRVPKVRGYRIIHEPYLHEYLRTHYPPFTWRTNVRLGVLPPPEEIVGLRPEEVRMLTRWHMEVDAIVLEPKLVTLIECIVRPEWFRITQLLLYERLFKVTEEFREHWFKPIRKCVLTPYEAPFFQAFAKDYNIDWLLYQPEWLREYIPTLRRRQQRFSIPIKRKPIPGPAT